MYKRQGDKIRPEGSKYAAYYIDQLKQLPPQGVINYSDIFDVKYDDQYEDKHFKINYLFTPIIFLLSLIHILSLAIEEITLIKCDLPVP